MLFIFNAKWLVDMYVNLLLASLNMMLIAEATCSGPQRTNSEQQDLQ